MSHLPRHARAGRVRDGMKEGKHSPTPLVLESLVPLTGIQEPDADPLRTGATNTMNTAEAPRSSRTIPHVEDSLEPLFEQSTAPLSARPNRLACACVHYLSR